LLRMFAPTVVMFSVTFPLSKRLLMTAIFVVNRNVALSIREKLHVPDGVLRSECRPNPYT
jgi:hypothetical protein